MIACPKCNAECSPKTVLDSATVSWPELLWVWFKCPQCEQHSQIEVGNNIMATINFMGAPGPNWERIKSTKVESLTVRSDPSFLQCWLNDDHYEFPARE